MVDFFLAPFIQIKIANQKKIFKRFESQSREYRLTRTTTKSHQQNYSSYEQEKPHRLEQARVVAAILPPLNDRLLTFRETTLLQNVIRIQELPKQYTR